MVQLFLRSDNIRAAIIRAVAIIMLIGGILYIMISKPLSIFLFGWNSTQYWYTHFIWAIVFPPIAWWYGRSTQHPLLAFLIVNLPFLALFLLLWREMSNWKIGNPELVLSQHALSLLFLGSALGFLAMAASLKQYHHRSLSWFFVVLAAVAWILIFVHIRLLS